MMHFSAFLRNFAVWTGILQRLKPNSEKAKTQQHTESPSPWAFMFFFNDIFLAHFMINVICEYLQRSLHPGMTMEDDLASWFQMAPPLGPKRAQDSGYVTSWRQEPAWPKGPTKEQQLFCSPSGVLDLVCNSLLCHHHLQWCPFVCKVFSPLSAIMAQNSSDR